MTSGKVLSTFRDTKTLPAFPNLQCLRQLEVNSNNSGPAKDQGARDIVTNLGGICCLLTCVRFGGAASVGVLGAYWNSHCCHEDTPIARNDRDLAQIWRRLYHIIPIESPRYGNITFLGTPFPGFPIAYPPCDYCIAHTFQAMASHISHMFHPRGTIIKPIQLKKLRTHDPHSCV